MRLEAVADVSRAVAGTAARLEKVGHLAGLLARVPPAEVPIVIAFLSGEPRQGRMKIGGAVLSGLRDVPAADAATIELREVDALFDRIAALSGSGSAGARVRSCCASCSRGPPPPSRIFCSGCCSASCGRARWKAC